MTDGEFGVWAVAANGNWYGGDLVAASAPRSHDLTARRAGRQRLPVAVMYRPTAGSGAWIFPVAYSAAFAVTTPYPAVTVTAPTGTPASYAQGDAGERHLDGQPQRHRRRVRRLGGGQ